MKVDEESLTSLLPTPPLRAELALLIALCTDDIRRHAANNFLLPDTYAPSSHPSNTSPSRPEESLINFDDPESDTNIEMERKRRQRHEDLSSPRMQGMRRATLSFIDSWRIGVLRRVGEVLNVRAQDIRQKRAEYNTEADSATKEQKKQEYYAQTNETLAGTNNLKMDIPNNKKIPTPLAKLDEAKRSKILLCLLLLILSLENYSAHSRVLLKLTAASLHLPASTLANYESTVAHSLLSAASNMSSDESVRKEAVTSESGRRWKVGLATVAGAALIGVTGGLAAPFLAAGVGAVMGGLGLSIPLIGGYLGAMIGSSVLIGGLFGSYGGRMTGRMMEKYAREVQDFSFIPLGAAFENSGLSMTNKTTVASPTNLSKDRSRRQHVPVDQVDAATSLTEEDKLRHKLRVAIGISGWLTDEREIIDPWHVFQGSSIEPFALRWEVTSLLDLGISISTVLKSYAWSIAKTELIRHTIFGVLLAGLWPLGLIKLASTLDNPFSVAKARSDKAGRVLAEALMQKAQGERPVTLVGYSLGARVIYQALLVLAEQNAFGLVESVVLIGAPVPRDERAWRRIRAAVSGRVVNVFSADDYILGFLYRTSSLQFGVAGLEAVESVDGVENFDAAGLLNGKGHARYRYVIGQVLQKIAFEDIDPVMVEKEVDIIKTMDKAEALKTRDKAFSKQASPNDAEVDEYIQETTEQVEREIKMRKVKASVPANEGERNSEEHQGIAMVDMEEEQMMEEQPKSTDRRSAPLLKATEQLHIRDSAERLNDGTDSDTETPTSTPLNGLVSLAPEPVPEDSL
ncbi:MAG: hypothetical protein Q9214_002658 [Letrouitia sp. 1 TL-2023]